MTGSLHRPDLAAEIRSLKQRVSDLERVRRRTPQISAPEPAPAGGGAVLSLFARDVFQSDEEGNRFITWEMDIPQALHLHLTWGWEATWVGEFLPSLVTAAIEGPGIYEEASLTNSSPGGVAASGSATRSLDAPEGSYLVIMSMTSYTLPTVHGWVQVLGFTETIPGGSIRVAGP